MNEAKELMKVGKGTPIVFSMDFLFLYTPTTFFPLIVKPLVIEIFFLRIFTNSAFFLSGFSFANIHDMAAAQARGETSAYV